METNNEIVINGVHHLLVDDAGCVYDCKYCSLDLYI
jgi:hypothetical protein